MVKFSRKAAKQAKKLPFEIVETLGLLVSDLTHYGPETSRWPNYSKLQGNKIVIIAIYGEVGRRMWPYGRF